MKSAIITLFEGDYHYGLGALVNSLCAQAYRGTVFAGYRGALPPWARNVRQKDSFAESNVADGLCIRFVPLETRVHLTNYKPEFMLQVWEKHCPEAGALFYFDPDITVKCRWTFFEEWADAGVAVCQDINGWMPENHPIRHSWRRHLEPHGLRFSNSLDAYFNGGFIGLSTHNRMFLPLWSRIQTLIEQSGTDLQSLGVGDRTLPFTCRDQDALNIACMATELPVSPIGQDGMDFQSGGGGYIMSHAAGGVKPWRKKLLATALFKGTPPSRADKAFFKFVMAPIRLFSPARHALKVFDLKLASAIGRYMRGF